VPTVTEMLERRPTLEEAKRVIGGGYIQMITLPNGDQLLLDEDGKFKGLPVNVQATALADDILHPGDVIVGDVLILKGEARWVD